jgi:diguanylate cyclase (GGDEF)-like protein
VSVVLLLGLGSFAAFTLYLRRVLSLLDPSAVIPERVRSAFDVFSGGVMIIDPACRLMLVNAALRGWMGGEADQGLNNRAVDTLDWFKPALPEDRNQHPWVQAMASGVAAQGAQLEFKLASGEPLRAVVNASPILDGLRKVRGCLVTFENVTPLHNLNVQLVKSMGELEESKREVEKKNDALQELATRDPLTGCLNRRALFNRLERLFLDARDKGHPLCCIMSDIDHFKLFNDRHGHAVGDQVLQAVTRSLGSALREVDLLARYGGEEFCIILPEADLAQACAVAERLRADVQVRAGQSIRSTSGLEVTSSFGVSVIDAEILDPAQLIDRADKALYAAKKAGRNRVMTYQAPLLEGAEAAASAEPALH